MLPRYFKQSLYVVDFFILFLFNLFDILTLSDITTQLEDFKVYVVQQDGFPPFLVYDNSVTGDDVTTPITIPIGGTVRSVVVTRPNSPLTLCEVEIYTGKW